MRQAPTTKASIQQNLPIAPLREGVGADGDDVLVVGVPVVGGVPPGVELFPAVTVTANFIP